MADLLLHFDSLFAELVGLPPQRTQSHQIWLLPGTTPIALRPYRYAHAQKAELERQCAQMLQLDNVWPSSLALSTPVLLMKKSDNSWRLCVDYHALNAEKLLDKLRGIKYFTKLDLRSGYHQVCMHSANVEKTVFRTLQGLFEFLVMPFGLTNASATFQAMMNDILKPFLRRFIPVLHPQPVVVGAYTSCWLSCRNTTCS
jgi:hypothetical protein